MKYEQSSCGVQGRSYSYTQYRYGFNNQEQDGKLGEYYAFEYRIHDARLGKFLSVDQLAQEYPWNSTYAFAANKVIWGIELEGFEVAPISSNNIVTHGLYLPPSSTPANYLFSGPTIAVCQAEKLNNSSLYGPFLANSYKPYIKPLSSVVVSLELIPIFLQNYDQSQTYRDLVTRADIFNLNTSVRSVPSKFLEGNKGGTEVKTGNILISNDFSEANQVMTFVFEMANSANIPKFEGHKKKV